eukprot:gene12253-15398_t
MALSNYQAPPGAQVPSVPPPALAEQCGATASLVEYEVLSDRSILQYLPVADSHFIQPVCNHALFATNLAALCQVPPPALYKKHVVLHEGQYPAVARAGLLTFSMGNLLQCWSHVALARLSLASKPQQMQVQKAVQEEVTEQRAGNNGRTTFYQIPRGGMFELVSCPHYLGEVVIYAGLMLIMRGQLNSVLMLCWVVSGCKESALGVE